LKRGGPTHPKTTKLARRLDLTRYEAVGLLECLFHWAGAYARRGDIGRHEPGDIAEGIGWEGDPQLLLTALTESGWLDKCECHGLRIHGWKKHADQAVRKTREVLNGGFLECYESGGSMEAGRKSSTKNVLSADSRHKTHDSRHRTPGGGAAPKRTAWTSEAGDDHQEFLGSPQWDRIGKALGPLVAKHSWPVVRPIWREACRKAAAWSEPAKFTPEVFARTFTAELAKRKPPGDNPTGDEESPKARAIREAAEEQARGVS
jgi:hypothetical protein